MRFLTISILLVSLSLISCARRFDNVKKHNKQGKQTPLQVVNNEVNVDVFQKVSVNYFVGNNRRNIQPICRGIDGCLSVCEYFDYAKCKQLSADEVVSFWLNKISEYNSWEQARNDLDLIATNLNVSSFLKNVDQDNHVVRNLLRLNTSADCPMNNTQIIYFSYSPSASLYLKSTPSLDEASAPAAGEEVAEPTAPPPVEVVVPAAGEEDAEPAASSDSSDRKKIVDGSVIHFDLQVFMGFIKSCFGYNTRTFSEMAVQIENQDAFEIAHAVLSKSCGENSECVRLAYCEIGSDLVWDKLQESVKAPGCEYGNFVEMLP